MTTERHITDAANLCECGHPAQTHRSYNYPAGPGPCHATVYVRVGTGATGGMNASPCKCKTFRKRGPRVYA